MVRALVVAVAALIVPDGGSGEGGGWGH
ncbi:uncharacterized protein G2W53_021258 [Senna tora]|uniref:Uncharacterized protein n=1 Tax=Senna tora TaxID=362788 RepID=A0A834WN96_9FABA|nr:uncharacterized protein G2W53_021258 [Senna tora]